jgi:uncharacterized membrane protein YdfJ with MMPL/SSD domain
MMSIRKWLISSQRYAGIVLERWTRAVVRWRVVVVACWVAIILLGALSAFKLPDLLTTSLTVPGTSSAQANEILAHHFDENIEGSFTVILHQTKPSSSELVRLNREFATAAESVPTSHVSKLSLTEGVLYGTVTTSLNLARAASFTEPLRHALTNAGLENTMVTGAPALQHDITPVLTSDLRHGELLAVLVALVVLFLVLGLLVGGTDPSYRGGLHDGRRSSRSSTLSPTTS